MAKIKAESLESMIKKGVTKHQALATVGMKKGKKKVKKGKKDKI